MSWRSLAAQAAIYPPTPRDTTVDDYHGVRVADPYRWLEQLDAPATRTWVEAQSRLTYQYLRDTPQRDAIRQRLAALSGVRRTEVPWREAGQVFFLENSGARHQAVLYRQGTPGDTPRPVLDPQQISPDGASAVRNFSVLLRVASDASHGYASEAGAIAQWADVFAFCARALDFRVP